MQRSRHWEWNERTQKPLHRSAHFTTEELVDVLAETDSIRIERIVSTGHSSPEDFWYDQDEHEFVVVLKGEATLRFADDENHMHMKPGDFVNIPAHRKHRVASTSPNEPTVWLAVFYQACN